MIMQLICTVISIMKNINVSKANIITNRNIVIIKMFL